MWIYLDRFVIKTPILSFREIRPVVSALMHDEKLTEGQADCGAERETVGRRDMTKLIGPLCDY
jgi:hypothetical protein